MQAGHYVGGSLMKDWQLGTEEDFEGRDHPTATYLPRMHGESTVDPWGATIPMYHYSGDFGTQWTLRAEKTSCNDGCI